MIRRTLNPGLAALLAMGVAVASTSTEKAEYVDEGAVYRADGKPKRRPFDEPIRVTGDKRSEKKVRKASRPRWRQ